MSEHHHSSFVEGCFRCDLSHDETRTVQFERLVAEEDLILAATEAIAEAMHAQGVTHRELAERLGKSETWLRLVLRGRSDITLRQFADVMHALGPTCQRRVYPRSAR